jgi:leucyl-tRNA synthetase
MESTTQVHKEEEKKSSRARYDHLRNIEKEVQEKYNLEESFYAAPKEGYEQQSWEDKNAEKYFVTFPFPYTNGYLHLGK